MYTPCCRNVIMTLPKCKHIALGRWFALKGPFKTPKRQEQGFSIEARLHFLWFHHSPHRPTLFTKSFLLNVLLRVLSQTRT